MIRTGDHHRQRHSQQRNDDIHRGEPRTLLRRRHGTQYRTADAGPAGRLRKPVDQPPTQLNEGQATVAFRLKIATAARAGGTLGSVNRNSTVFACFSIEIARVLLACGGEVDVVCKQICKSISATSSAGNINSYRDEIQSSFPSIPSFPVTLPQFGLTLTPWDEWTKPNGVPLWWTAYNKTKHHRDAEYHRANLENMLNAIAGLFVMVLYLYRDKAQSGELVPAPQLLHVAEQHCRGIDHSRNRLAFFYVL